MRKRVLILGGARSGKSSYALKEASRIKGKKAFVATAEAHDGEMKERIEHHRKERGTEWHTFEEPVEVPSLVMDLGDRYEVILVDCLTLWVSNIMHRELSFDEYADQLVGVLSGNNPALLYVVSNEVGLGLVPETPLGRHYRDNLGRLNARVAETATDVLFLAAGIPLNIKGE